MLFSFLGIYMINITCTINNVIEWCEETSDNHRAKPGDHDHSLHTHKTDTDKKSNDKDDDGCCKDFATIFFASVQSPTQQIDFDFTPIQYCVLFNFITVDYPVHFMVTIFTETRPPPPLLANPDTRIFIQSFQI